MINDFSYPQRLRSSTFRSSLALLLPLLAFAAAKVEERERENYSITFSKLGNSVLYLYFFSLSSSAFIKVQEFYKSLELAGNFPARGKQEQGVLPVGKKR